MQLGLETHIDREKRERYLDKYDMRFERGGLESLSLDEFFNVITKGLVELALTCGERERENGLVMSIAMMGEMT